MASVFINEFHYDNVGGDTGEFVEVAGPAGTDLTGWSIVLYNGNGGVPYSSIPLSGTIDDEGLGTGALSFLAPNIQNGSPDGLALVDNNGDVVEFLSYEGSFTAIGGPADGLTSTDVGVSEDPAPPAGQSLQRQGTGDDSSDFTFVGPAAESPGSLNASQTFECFLTGTLILAASDEVPVETLKVGDLVKTAQGELVAVKWIGYQTFEEGTPSHPFRTFPIQIKAGALGNNLPQRDLFVSPDHAILVDSLLINAGALENGVSIIATQPQESFTYYHIELEQHSLLIAEGTYAESFLPQNQGRDTFDNGDEYETLYPNHNILSLLPMSFPRVSSKRQLPRSVAKRLMAVAETLPGIKVAAAV